MDLVTRIYRQRWQIESPLSCYKRRLDPALRARTWCTQKQECWLRILTHTLQSDAEQQVVVQFRGRL